ncbi:hypothetical protein Syn8016DRAFT_2301 [Synechococcus sp. WH 8016]|nr:hypothetical protein Syn8016DRAFT_2301 [Synechococcus sp. WH 8016]
MSLAIRGSRSLCLGTIVGFDLAFGCVVFAAQLLPSLCIFREHRLLALQFLLLRLHGFQMHTQLLYNHLTYQLRRLPKR